MFTALVIAGALYLLIGLIAMPKLDPEVKPVDWAAAAKRTIIAARWAPLLIKKYRANKAKK